jgi:mannose-6-phosphate isomerase-like protein (cupin superfamily)
MKTINISEKLGLFNDHWHPRIVAELNGQYVKLAKFQGEFPWHMHENEDEMFMVIKGEFNLEYRERTETLKAGEFIVVPKGVEHRPVATNEVEVMLFEPKTTLNTGDKQNEMTLNNLEWI